MKTRQSGVVGAILSLLAAAGTAGATPQLAIDPSGYQLVSKTRIDRATVACTYRASVVNTGTEAWSVVGTVSTATGLEFIDNSVTFGHVPAGGRTFSTDTFTVRQSRTRRLNLSALSWKFTSSGSPFALRLGTDQVSAYRNSTVNLRFTIQRAAGFNGEIEVALDSPSEQISAPPPVLGESFSDGLLRIQIGPDVSTGPTQLMVIASTEGSIVTSLPLQLNVGEAQPSSQELIEAARASGTIDLGTSLLYRAYAWFGDLRLPPEFRGSGSKSEDNRLIEEIEAALGTLAPSLEAALIPFTLRPSQPGSWFDLSVSKAGVSSSSTGSNTTGLDSRSLAAGEPVVLPTDCIDVTEAGGWVSERSQQNKVRVWVYCLDNDPERSRAAYDVRQTWLKIADRIWPRMTASDFMGEPLPDNLAGAENAKADLGDEAIDIYATPDDGPFRNGEQFSIGDAVAKAIKVPTTNASPSSSQKSGYILVQLQDTATEGPAQARLVHELMHVVQWKYNAVISSAEGGPDEYWWFADASADWAAAWADRIAPPPRRAAGSEIYENFTYLFQSSDLPLNDPGDHRYTAFIWPYFLEQQKGHTFISDSWKKLVGVVSWDDGDNVLDGMYPFEEHFRRFTRRNINSAGSALSAAERYNHLDPAEFKDGEEPIKPLLVKEDLELEPMSGEYVYQGAVKPLAAGYWHFGFTDPTTRKVIFNLAPSAGIQGLDLDGMYLSDGSWKREELNGRDRWVFCFDEPGREVKEVWLAASNHLRFAKGGDVAAVNFRVQVSSAPCEAVWVGTSRYYSSTPGGPYYEAEANVVWRQLEDSSGQPTTFGSSEGTVLVVRAGVGDCRYLLDIPAKDITAGNGQLTIYYDADPPLAHAWGSSAPWHGNATVSCPEEPDVTIDAGYLISGFWLETGDFSELSQDPDTGQLIFMGSWTNPANEHEGSSWEFRLDRM